MADITTLPDSAVLFLDEVKDLYLPGSISEPKYIEVSHHYSRPSRPGQSAIGIDTLVEGYFYAEFNERISLDFSNAISNLIDYNPDSSFAKAGEWIVWSYGASASAFSAKHTYIFLASSAVRERITDIDYLAVPEGALFWLNYYMPAGYKFSYGIEQAGMYTELYSSPSADDQDKIYSSRISAAEIQFLPEKPFRFIVNLSSADSSQPEMMYRSPIYEITSGVFQDFVFADRFGGFTYFPMYGALELAPEYEFENARYSSGTAKVSGICTPVFTQYTGGLTMKAATALSALLMSNCIYHKVGNKWQKIIIESADIRFQTVDSLHYGSFSFRYADDMSLPDVF